MKKSQIKTGFILHIAQAVEYLLPLLAIPYILLKIGVEGYGKVAFSQALGTYALLLTDYGFSYIGTRDIANNKNNKQKISEIFWSITLIKTILLFFGCLMLFMLSITFEPIKNLSYGIYIAILPAIGSIIFPLWFFNGIEFMRTISIISMLCRVFLFLLIFIFIENTDDIYIAQLILQSPTVLIGLITTIFIMQRKYIYLITPSKINVVYYFFEAKHAFYATASSAIYRSSNTIILGLLTTSSHVAFYSIVEKIVKATQEINRPIMQITYPRICNEFIINKEKLKKTLRTIFHLIITFFSIVAIILYFASDTIINLIGGIQMSPAATLLKIMALAPLIGSINMFLGVQTLHAFGHSKIFSKFVFYTGIFSLLIIYPCIYFKESIGAAYAYLMSETFLLICLTYFHCKIDSPAIKSIKWKQYK